MDPLLGEWLIPLLTIDTGLKLLFGALFGLCMGLTGVGGGILLIPILQLCFGMHAVLAVGTASMISALVKISAATAHVKQNNIAWRPTMLMLCGALPITLLTTHLIVYLSNQPAYAPLINQGVEACILLIMSGSLLIIFRKYRQSCVPTQAPRQVAQAPRTAIVSGMLCGSVLGATGVGGGVLLLPLLNSTLGVDIKRAVGSANVLSLLLSGLIAVGYSQGGQADMPTALLLVIGSLAGVPAAGYLLTRISEQMVYLITLAIIALSLILTLLK